MTCRIQWLGHAAFRITTASATIFIDPWLEDNPMSALRLDDVEHADLILVTHDHFDHAADAVKLARKTGAKLVAQPETVERMRGEGLKGEQAVAMNIGGTFRYADVAVTMTQAFHSSATGAPCGFIVKTEHGTIYHAGDTGIFEGMRLLAEIYGIDVALLPIGGHYVMDPTQAAHALRLLRPKVAIPMHYKTFPVLVQSADDFVTLAKELAPETKVVVLNPGDTYEL
ncbi:MAG: metal-dependent hydrolase [Candidatus Alkanophagales archaeon]